MFIIKYLKSLLYILASTLILSFIVGTLNYFNIIGTNTTKIFELISLVISIALGGIYLGKNSTKKGYLEGLKIGLVVIVLLFIFAYLAFDKSFSLSTLIFYLIILISAVLGSILGINKKSSK